MFVSHLPERREPANIHEDGTPGPTTGQRGGARDSLRLITKRAFDLLLSLVGTVFLAPVFLLIMLAVAVDSKGPVFFRQLRVGRNGRPFYIYKFRTMIVDAEQKGGLITPDDDPRVTSSGRLLRKLKLDELPQLVNVVRGEMSLVGPRPEVPRYVDMYTETQREVLALVPGITDPASLRYRDEGALLATAESPENFYREVIMPDKIRINLEYARRATIVTDLALVCRTLTCFLGR